MAALMQQGRAVHQQPFAVPDLHHGQRLGHGDRPHAGDTGDFSNTIYAGFPVPGAGDSLTPFLESDPCSATSTSISPATISTRRRSCARRATSGFSTASIGKLGPALIFDHTPTARQGNDRSIVVDDSTGTPDGIPLSAEVKARLPPQACPAGADARRQRQVRHYDDAGNAVANVEQQDYFADVATKAVLPLFKERNKPFVLVFWSRDPDGTPAQSGRQPEAR